MNRILCQIRRAALMQAGPGPTDAELLELFIRQRDEAAFEALLRRHAPMVLGVCRRVLHHAQDAEDAFQATFLVLARKAASLRARDLLGPWLYRIAFRTALKARAMNAKRHAKERQARLDIGPGNPSAEEAEELLARLDIEISRLPEKYRAAVVLCELQGKGRKEVAALLGVPEGTLSSRLAYARKILARRLGSSVALSGGLLSGVLACDAVGAVPGSLLKATSRAAVLSVRGEFLLAGAVSAQVLTLTDGVMKAMLLSKLKGAGVLVLALALGVGGLTYHQAMGQTGGPDESRRTARTTVDELEELRLEIAALRKGLEATRQRVRMLEQRQGALPQRKTATTSVPRAGGQQFKDVTHEAGLDSVPRAGGQPPALPPAAGNPGSALPGISEQPGAAPTSALPGSVPQSGGAPTSALPGGAPQAGAAPTSALPGGAPQAGAAPSLALPGVRAPGPAGMAPLGLPHTTGTISAAPPHDAFSRVETAIRHLRARPDDKNAANELERAMRSLRLEIRKTKTGDRPAESRTLRP